MIPPFHKLKASPYPRVQLDETLTLVGNHIQNQEGIKLVEIDSDILTEFSGKLLDSSSRSISRDTDLAFSLLAKNGFLKERVIQSNDVVGWLSVVCRHQTEINRAVLELHSDKSIISQLIEKTATKEQIIEWIRRCFQYTHSAYFHISGVVENSTLNPEERAFWESFRKDEMHHWKIYERIFQFLGISLEEERKRPRHKDVEAFVKFLHETGQRSMYEYASLLYMMEMAPGADSIENDLQFGTLVKHYGFPIEAIEPLWAHAKYNAASEHDDIWFNVLRSKDVYTVDEAEAILSNALVHCRLAQKWNQIG